MSHPTSGSERNPTFTHLCSFDEDLGKLSQIPILPPLIQGAEEQPFHAFDEVFADTNESFAANLEKEFNKELETAESPASSTQGDEVPAMKNSNQKSSMTLLQWISSSENQKALKRMAENCTRELEVFDKNVMETLKDEIEKTVESACREDMKEIKGLEERLRGLENLMFDARKVVQEQNDLSQAFQQNQARAANLGDQSILPDLCASHRNQLIVMQKNHKRLRDIRVRCGKAKDELGKNLYQRLKFVIHVENRMYDIDSKLLFYHTCLRRLQKHLGIIEQIHQAPCVYVQAVTEVVRRRIFSTAFLMVNLVTFLSVPSLTTRKIFFSGLPTSPVTSSRSTTKKCCVGRSLSTRLTDTSLTRCSPASTTFRRSLQLKRRRSSTRLYRNSPKMVRQ